MITVLPSIHHYGSRPGYKTVKSKSDIKKLENLLNSCKEHTVTVEKETLLTVMNILKQGERL